MDGGKTAAHIPILTTFDASKRIMPKWYYFIVAVLSTLTIGISLLVTSSSLAVQFLVISTLALMILPVIIALRQKHREHLDTFAPVWAFSIIYTAGYGYKAALIALSPEDFITFPEYFPNSPTLMGYAFILSMFGLVAFYIGYFSGCHLILMKCMPHLNGKANQRMIYFFALLSMIVGIYPVVEIIQMTSTELNLSNIVFNISVRQKFMAENIGKGFLTFAINLTPIFALACLHYAINSKKNMMNWIIVIMSFLIAFLSAAIIWSRILLLSIIIGTIALYHYEIKRIGLVKAWMVCLISVWLAGALGIWMAPRDYTISSIYDIVRRLGGSLEFFDHLVTALVRVQDYFWGLTIIEDMAITYLPRIFFPWKPLIYGQVRLQETILPGLYAGESAFAATMAMGILGEGYANFGLAGVFLVPLLAGILLRAIYRKGEEESGYYMVIHSYILGSLFSVIRGFGSFLVSTMLMIVLFWMIDRGSGFFCSRKGDKKR
jgi:oligosaccharide repeat unit polymerase